MKQLDIKPEVYTFETCEEFNGKIAKFNKFSGEFWIVRKMKYMLK